MVSRTLALLLFLGTTQISAQQTTLPLPPVPPPAAPSGDYLVGAGDILQVTVYGEKELTGSFRVDNDGTFPYQYLNRVKAEGLTTQAIEESMEKALADGFLRNPQVSVEVREYRSKNVWVQGQVRAPGKYPLPANASLMDAIFLAGSTTADAGNWVEIYRQRSAAAPGPSVATAPGNKPDERIKLTDVQSGIAQSIKIQDNDTIFVPKAQVIYVAGMVRAPGAFRFDDGMTVFEAISLAGGVNEKGSNSRMSIVRFVNGQRKEVDAKSGDMLQPGDQVVVKARRL
ncbi:MAG: polysaccharide biosynthesis/export family protein [Vicinamibacterales bacterium]|nr:polysaccharide biosynthesis/export family protein [Vicinamibacterales bacterium]